MHYAFICGLINSVINVLLRSSFWLDRWNTATDTLSLAPKVIPSDSFISKRDLLQGSSQIYDSLGWATPVTIKAKVFVLQEIW